MVFNWPDALHNCKKARSKGRLKGLKPVFLGFSLGFLSFPLILVVWLSVAFPNASNCVDDSLLSGEKLQKKYNHTAIQARTPLMPSYVRLRFSLTISFSLAFLLLCFSLSVALLSLCLRLLSFTWDLSLGI